MADLTQQQLNDTLLEKSVCFAIDGTDYAFYPLTLGKMIMLQSCIEELGLNMRKFPHAEFLKMAVSEKEKCAKALAIYASKTKDDMFSSAFRDLVERFCTLRPEDIASLLLTLLSQPNVGAYKKHLGIDKEESRMKKVSKVKDSKNTYTFGGVSMYGTVMDRACERYGWTYDYVLWGISFMNLQLMLSDSVQSVYLTDKEAKKCHVSNDRNKIDGDSKEAMDAFIRSQSGRS